LYYIVYMHLNEFVITVKKKIVDIKTLAGPEYTYEIIKKLTCHFLMNWCTKFEQDRYSRLKLQQK